MPSSELVAKFLQGHYNSFLRKGGVMEFRELTDEQWEYIKSFLPRFITPFREN